MNTETMELNLNEMEMINGGWNLKDGLTCILTGGVLGASCGGVLFGLPGVAAGGVLGAGLGAGVSFM